MWAGPPHHEAVHWPPRAPPRRPGPAAPRSQLQEWARRRAPAARRPAPARHLPLAAAPAKARSSASPSPCGAARLGPAPTPRSPRRLPGPPSSDHVTRRRRRRLPDFKQLYRQQPGRTATRPRGWTWGRGPGALPGPPRPRLLPWPRPRRCRKVPGARVHPNGRHVAAGLHLAAWNRRQKEEGRAGRGRAEAWAPLRVTNSTLPSLVVTSVLALV